MAEEYQNYRAMMEEAQRWAEHQEEQPAAEPPAEGIVLAEDLAAVERRLEETFDHLLHRFEELHTRLWELEARVQQLERRERA